MPGTAPEPLRLDAEVYPAGDTGITFSWFARVECPYCKVLHVHAVKSTNPQIGENLGRFSCREASSGGQASTYILHVGKILTRAEATGQQSP